MSDEDVRFLRSVWVPKDLDLIYLEMIPIRPDKDGNYKAPNRVMITPTADGIQREMILTKIKKSGAIYRELRRVG